MSREVSQSLYRFIEGRIICGGFGTGEKLPSLRQFARRFAISDSAVRRVLVRLANRGYVEMRHGSGCYVAQQRELPGGGAVSVVSVPFDQNNLDTNLTGIAYSGVRERLAALGIKQTHYCFHAKEFSDREYDAIARKSDGMILLGGYDAVLRDPRAGVPAVGLVIHHSFDGLFSVLDLDPVRAAELAAEFFRERGIRHVVMVNRNRLNYQFRVLCFADRWNQEGETLEMTDFSVKEFQKDTGYLYVFGADAYHNAIVYNESCGGILSRDHAVLCIDGMPMFDYHSKTDVPSIAINWRQAGYAAADELLRRMTRPGSVARRIYLNPELYQYRQKK